MLKAVGLALSMLALGSSEVIPFNNEAIEKVFQEKNPALFLFTSSNGQSKEAKEAFNQLDQTAPEGVLLTNSDSDDGFGLYDRLAEYLGVDTKTTPQVLYFGTKNDKYRFEAEITKENLADFVKKVQAGQIEQFLKSAPIPEENGEAVRTVVGKNFKEVVLDSEKEVLVEFYAPWCGHCKNLAPHYEAAAKKLAANPNIVIAKVDSTENEVAGLDIQGFPTLKWWGKDKSAEPIEYNGGRDTEGLIAWIKDHTEYDWVEIEGEEEKAEDGEL